MSETIQSLENKYQELELRYKSVPKRKWIFRLATLAFLALVIMLSIILGSIKENGYIRAQQEFMESDDIEVLSDYFNNDAVRGNAEAMERLETYTIGIPNNIALSGISRSCYVNLNYLNKLRNVKVWRDVKTGRLMAKDGEEIIDVGNIKVDEIIAVKGKIYYIQEADGYLCYYDLIEQYSETLLAEPIQSFAVVGNQIFALSKRNNIIRYSIEENKSEVVVTNVQRFYIAGNLFVQNGEKIYSVGLDGKNKELIIDKALLVGADSKNLYITDSGTGVTRIVDSLSQEGLEIYSGNLLYSLDLKSRDIKVIKSSRDTIRAAYSIEKGIVIDTVK